MGRQCDRTRQRPVRPYVCGFKPCACRVPAPMRSRTTRLAGVDSLCLTSRWREEWGHDADRAEEREEAYGQGVTPVPGGCQHRRSPTHLLSRRTHRPSRPSWRGRPLLSGNATPINGRAAIDRGESSTAPPRTAGARTPRRPVARDRTRSGSIGLDGRPTGGLSLSDTAPSPGHNRTLKGWS